MKHIQITDRIYGNIIIDEPIVISLLQSPFLQRLKDIDQAGFFQPQIHHDKHTRFEHSVGVYYLLRIFQAPLEEQIAGLIHDVSHGVFSHCLDYALGGTHEGKQSHQDDIFEKFVINSDIPTILASYGFDSKLILDETRHPLKETSIPDLCADRLDYSLRSSSVYQHTPIKTIRDIVRNLTIRNNQWVFTDYLHAKIYAEIFYLLNIMFYSGLPSAIMFRTVGDVVSYALKKNYFSYDDLYKTDSYVLAIIKKRAKTDQDLSLLFSRMCNPKGITNNPDHYDCEVVCKSRIVDPYFLEGKNIKRLSKKYTKWKTVIQQELKPKRYFLKFSD